MKIIMFLTLLLSTQVFAMEKVSIMTGKLYIPQGYDSNDLVEVTISGKLPDSCHRSPTYEIVKNDNTFEIYLYAYHVPSPEGCKKISIPYMETIVLGLMPAGKYAVELKGAKTTYYKTELKIKEAINSLQDDFIYGNVLNIIEEEDSREIEIIGTNPTDCLYFERLDVEIQKEVVVLRPLFREIGECRQEPTVFSFKYKVPFLSKSPRGVLLHVRVMGGRSYNYLYQNKHI